MKLIEPDTALILCGIYGLFGKTRMDMAIFFAYLYVFIVLSSIAK